MSEARAAATRAGVRQITGRAVALDRANVDTDQIIPAAWLKWVERTGFGAGLFEAWRADPEFPLNRPGADQAVILVAGANFGCGSSREHAVWALQDYGFRAVVAPGFADIFRTNAISAGLVPAQVSEEDAGRLFGALRADPDAELVLDVDARTVAAGPIRAAFALADYARWRLLEGLDDIALTLLHEDSIGSYEARRPAWLPTVTGTPGTGG